MIRALIVFAALAACSHDDRPSPCELGVFVAQVQAEDRKIIGHAADYPADTMLRAREAELAASQSARREVAWDTVAKVLAPIELAATIPGVYDSRMPRWQTWYGEDDIDRTFLRMYEGLGVGGRAARERFTEAAIDEAFEWNTTAVDELPNWSADRWLEYVAAIDSAEKLAGVGSIARVGYDAPAARHMLASYPEIIACMAGDRPPAFADGPSEGTRRAVRDTASMQQCQQRTYGPFFVAGGETLRALVETDGYVELVVREGTAPGGAEACRDDDTPVCEVTGAGPYMVDVIAGDGAVDVVVVVEYDEAKPTWAACLDGVFDMDAVVVKADWRRAQFDFQLPVYDTSAQALARVMSADMPDWGAGDTQADPGPSEIYTLTLANGNTYRLAALHIMTKELDHWQWVTLWWSAQPDVDFGADRPAAIAALPEPWSNYKMCTATMFDERDPDPEGGYGAIAPTLAASLAAVHGGAGSPSWCSNPYLEAGPGNAATNCIGCHQHGGSGLTSEAIVGDMGAFPGHGRTQVRNNFPHDYSFAVDEGDRLGRNFLDVIEWYETFE